MSTPESGSPRIVAMGGGHGLYATLSAARRLTPHVTAVVTVADDGGSSGRLRSELDIVPPGAAIWRVPRSHSGHAGSTVHPVARSAADVRRPAPGPKLTM